jgi:hypothetical protein
MDEQNPGATPVESIPLPVPYKDRSAGLIIFGILTILLGCLAGLLTLMVIVQVASPSARAAGGPATFSTILPVASIYGILAVALVWLGIGSIMARRWARALLLIFSWIWLVMGLFIVVIMAFFVPRMMSNISASETTGHPAMPPSMIVVMMVTMFLVFGVLFVILPAVWTFFYGSRHVKATCETRDPVMRWTDACPLPVLGLCLWLAFSVPMMLLMAIAGHVVLPFFGMFLTGVPAAVSYLAIAVLWSYAAWSLYKLKPRGWWLILIALCVFMTSALLTYARHDAMEMYRLMGYPDAQIVQMQKTGLLNGNRMSWLMAFSVLPFLGYLLFIKKFLGRKS